VVRALAREGEEDGRHDVRGARKLDAQRIDRAAPSLELARWVPDPTFDI
jgi:hypothetical protein